MTARRWALLAVVAVALLLLIGRALAGVYVDYRWYSALGAVSLWHTEALLSGMLAAASGGLAALFIFANLYAVRHSVVSIVLPRRVGNVEIGPIPVVESSVLSFPVDDVDQWQRDMIVLVLERL